MTEYKNYLGDKAEVVIRSDGKAVWLNVDNDVSVRVSCDTVSVEDQRQTTFEELVEYLGTEIRELRLKCSQYSESAKRKAADARDARRYSDASRHNGRQDVYEIMVAQLQRIIDDYKLTAK